LLPLVATIVRNLADKRQSAAQRTEEPLVIGPKVTREPFRERDVVGIVDGWQAMLFRDLQGSTVQRV
jgi:hypothetical protein